MRTILVLLGLAASSALSGYLFILGSRTEWFDRAAAVGADTALLVGIAGGVGLVASVLAVRLHAEPQWLAIVILVLNAILAAVYAILFFIGKFGPVGPKI